MNGMELYDKLSKRDFSGSLKDKYAQDLQTIRGYAMLHNYMEDFYILLEKAHKENKQIVVNPPFDDNILYDDILLSWLTLA